MTKGITLMMASIAEEDDKKSWEKQTVVELRVTTMSCGYGLSAKYVMSSTRYPREPIMTEEKAKKIAGKGGHVYRITTITERIL